MINDRSELQQMEALVDDLRSQVDNLNFEMREEKFARLEMEKQLTRLQEAIASCRDWQDRVEYDEEQDTKRAAQNGTL